MKLAQSAGCSGSVTRSVSLVTWTLPARSSRISESWAWRNALAGGPA
jgi:hypothetical protein